MNSTIARNVLLARLCGLALLCALLAPARTRAEDHPLRLEVATGVLVFGDGPTSLEAGLSLDLGLSLDVTPFFVTRAAVGLAPVIDRHSIALLPRARVEAALQGSLGRTVPLFGAGGSLLGRSPALHAVLGLGFFLSPLWMMGVDARSGLFWDRDAVHGRMTPYGEAQLRFSRTFD